MKNTAFIIDCANVGWASSYAHSYMKQGDTPTGVMFGVLKSILDCTDVVFPNHVIFAWDSLKSRRKLIYPEYKQKTEVDFSEDKLIHKQSTEHQLDLLRYDILPQLGFNNHFYRTGFEADDVIASIVKQYDFELAVIVSNDSDLYQCIDENVVVYNHREHSTMTIELFYEQYNILPTHWAELKSLAGCSSDNVPGVEGVGEKRALDYIQGKLSEKSKAYRNIIAAIGTEAHNRDIKLVTLPFEQLNFEIQKDVISTKNFINVCKNYGLYKLIRAPELNRWKLLFSNLL